MSDFHRNWLNLLANVPRYYPPAQAWREEGMLWVKTGWPSSVFNGTLVELNTTLSRRHIDAIMTNFRHELHSIQFYSPTRTSATTELLHNAGYVELLSDPLQQFIGLYTTKWVNPEVRVYQTSTPAQLDTYYNIVAEAFDLPMQPADFADIMLKMRECYHVIAELNGEPVGAGTLVDIGHTAGVYNVATLSKARKQGVATAVMFALQQTALIRGHAGTALAASAMGLPLYQRLGYQHSGYQLVYVPR